MDTTPKIKIKNIFLHFSKICKHKWWVFYYCCKAGIPWRGVKHDMSKFSLVEFWESVRYYQGTSSPIDACKKDKGVSRAWMHHKGRNSHHYEYWVDNFDNGGQPVQMPYEDAVEMLCDYLGAGRAYMGKDFSYKKEYEWWVNKSSKPLAMHEHTKTFIQRALMDLQYGEEDWGFTKAERATALLKKEYLKRRYYSIDAELTVKEGFDLG